MIRSLTGSTEWETRHRSIRQLQYEGCRIRGEGINETLAKAVKQIEDRKYKDGLMDYRTLIIYGVRFDGKSAEVVLEDRIER